MNKIASIGFSVVCSVLSCCHSKSVKIEPTPVNKDSVISIQLNTNSQPVMNEEGLNTDYYSSGKEKMKGKIKNGQRDGLWQAWYENGNLWSEAEYKSGVNEGKSITYFENGKIRYEGNYRNGKKIGAWKFYDEQGKIVKTVEEH